MFEKEYSDQIMAGLVVTTLITSIFVSYFALSLTGAVTYTPISYTTSTATPRFTDNTQAALTGNQLLGNINKYKIATSSQKPQIINDIVKSSADRRDVLLKEMENNPKAFLNHTLKPADRNYLLSILPKQNKSLIEADSNLSGKLRVIHEDIFNKDGFDKSKFSYSVETGNKQSYNLYFVNKNAELSSGSTVRVSGTSLGPNMLAYSTDGGGGGVDIVSPSSTITMGEQKVLVIGINFAAISLGDTATFQKNIRDVVFDGPNSVNAYFKENSYGLTYLRGDIAGPYNSNFLGSLFCEKEKWIDYAKTSAIASGKDLNKYNRILIITPDSVCKAPGLGELGNNPSMTLSVGINKFVITHELSHNQGLLHANSLVCVDNKAPIADPSNTNQYLGCSNIEYGSCYDVLGSRSECGPYGQNIFQYDAPHKIYTGWIPNSRIVDVMKSGTYTIGPLESVDVKVLRIVRPDNNQAYYVGYRRPIGFDSSLPEAITNGVTINIGVRTRGVGSEQLLINAQSASKALTDGAIFKDEANGIEIKQISHTATSAIVTITLTNRISLFKKGISIIDISKNGVSLPGYNSIGIDGLIYPYTVFKFSDGDTYTFTAWPSFWFVSDSKAGYTTFGIVPAGGYKNYSSKNAGDKNYVFQKYCRDENCNSVISTNPNISGKFDSSYGTIYAFSVEDSSAPTMSVSHTPTTPLTGQTITITANAIDDARLLYIMIDIDGNHVKKCDINDKTGTCSYSISNLIGRHTYQGSAVDMTTKQTYSESGAFTVSSATDTTKPAVSVSTNPANPTTPQAITISAGATDDKALNKIEIYYDNSLVKSCTLSGTSATCSYYVGSTAPNRNHNYYAYAYDASGNSQKSTSGSFILYSSGRGGSTEY